MQNDKINSLNLSLFGLVGRAGQAGQVELLLVYGADPGSVDKSGNDAAELAERSGHASLASRLSSAQYELSDRLSYFLCQKTPEHSNGQVGSNKAGFFQLGDQQSNIRGAPALHGLMRL